VDETALIAGANQGMSINTEGIVAEVGGGVNGQTLGVVREKWHVT
jgi:hypothetical protein